METLEFKIRFFKDSIKFIALIICSLILLSAILFLNSEGTTWGNSIGLLGFVILFPAAFSMLKLSKALMTKTSHVIVAFTALIGLLFTIYIIVDTKIRLRAEFPNDGPVGFYPPEFGYQVFGLIICCYLIYASKRVKISKG